MEIEKGQKARKASYLDREKEIASDQEARKLKERK
jgi:hypothetical protein